MLNYETISSIEVNGKMGIKVQFADQSRRLTDEEYSLCRNFADDFIKLVRANSLKSDPAETADTNEERLRLLSCFTEPIYVEEIPNEYWPLNTGLYHRPRFNVTTTRGVIKIGCRKRVIVIDWQLAKIASDAKSLFPMEDVTKYDSLIHAHTYEKAKEYIDKLMISF